MAYQSVTLDSFGGLNLVGDPLEVGFNGAVDLLNVQFDRSGRLRSRPQFQHVGSLANVDDYYRVFPHRPSSGSMDNIIASTDALTRAYDGGGILLDSIASPSYGYVNINAAVYLAADTKITKFNGTVFSSPAGMTAVAAKHLCLQTPDNRLVAASGNRVRFSNPHDPADSTKIETFGADDYVDVSPDDGEEIQALVSWEGLVFAFKETKLAIFAGNTVDGTGGSVFNYRLVDFGASAADTAIDSLPLAAAAPEGVYFLARDGVYATTGGRPALISGAISVLWEEPDAGGLTVGGQDVFVPISLTYHQGCLYMVVNQDNIDGDDNYLMVYDIAKEAWSVWDTAVWSVTSNFEGLGPALNQYGLLAALSDGSGRVSRLTNTRVSVDWYYRTGWANLGSPDPKKIRSLSLWGEGAINMSMAVDYQTWYDEGTTLTLVTLDEESQRLARRGRTFSLELSGTGTATVNNVTLYTSGKKGSGER